VSLRKQVLKLWRITVPSPSESISLKIPDRKALQSSHTSGTTHLTAQIHIQREWNLQKHSCHNLKCPKTTYVVTSYRKIEDYVTDEYNMTTNEGFKYVRHF
jgi:hypothetical protein